MPNPMEKRPYPKELRDNRKTFPTLILDPRYVLRCDEESRPCDIIDTDDEK